jgi:integrase
MAFRMISLQKKSGKWFARKGIPKDVRAAYHALYRRGHEELFSAPASESFTRAKALKGAWEAEIENRIAALRAGAQGQSRDLTQVQAQALAGRWYQWWVGLHLENDLGDPFDWAQRIELLADEAVDATPYWDDKDPFFDGRRRGREPAIREEVHPRLAKWAQTAQFLASKGEVLTAEATTTFLDEVMDLYFDACALLERRAKGDYSPDLRPQAFPAFTREAPKRASKMKPAGSCLALFEAYIRAKNPAASTVNRWRAVLKTLDLHLGGRDLASFTGDEAQAWIASLRTSERDASTVKLWLVAARTVCEWARKQKRLQENPFAEVDMPIPRKRQTRESKEFSAEEQALILSAALRITDTGRPFAAACRWVPWVCAYTGARAGEITQLRGRDVQQRGDFIALQLTPDAGTIKSAQTRTVPLHEHLVEQGFLDYVKTKGDGPLFYSPAQATTGDPEDITNPKRPRAVKTRERLAAWVRKLGVTDPEVSPTHAWRHSYKRRAARAKIEKRIRDAMCGHAPETVGDEYETPTLLDIADAMRKFPRYEV